MPHAFSPLAFISVKHNPIGILLYVYVHVYVYFLRNGFQARRYIIAIIIIITITHFALYNKCYFGSACKSAYFNATRLGIKLFENTFWGGGGVQVNYSVTITT